jgi:hypothetical protein
VPAEDREFHLAWGVDERAFYDRKFWIDEDIFKDRNRYENYAAAFDGRDFRGRGIDIYLSEEASGFSISIARTWIDAMHASAEGAQYGATIGTVFGLAVPAVGVPMGAGVGLLVTGTFSAISGASLSIDAQKKEYEKEQKEKNKAAWDAARKREKEDPNFVGPVRPSEPPTGY